MKSIYGYFIGNSLEPFYDPGLDVNCPLCGKEMNEFNAVSTSFIAGDVPVNKSWFYRTHRDCINDPNNIDKIIKIESAIVDEEVARFKN